MSLVLRSTHFSRVPTFTRWSTRLASYALPLIAQNVPLASSPSSEKPQTCETFSGARTSSGVGRLRGMRLSSRARSRTRNCSSEPVRDPVPSRPSVRATLSSTTSSPRRPLRSMTTSARWAGPSRMCLRVTGWGSRPSPVPICTNGRPFESRRLYAEKAELLSSRSRYRTAAVRT